MCPLRWAVCAVTLSSVSLYTTMDLLTAERDAVTHTHNGIVTKTRKKRRWLDECSVSGSLVEWLAAPCTLVRGNQHEVAAHQSQHAEAHTTDRSSRAGSQITHAHRADSRVAPLQPVTNF